MSDFVSMELDDDKQLDMMTIMPGPAPAPRFPYGLKICLGEDEIARLGLGDCSAGDYLVFAAVACVSSCSEDKTDQGVKRRVELQIEEMKVLSGEGDGEETGEDEYVPPRKRGAV